MVEIALVMFGLTLGYVIRLSMEEKKVSSKNKSIINKMEHPYLKWEARKQVDFQEFKVEFRKYEWFLDWSYNTALYGKDTTNFSLTKYLWIIDGFVLEPKTEADCVAIHNFIFDYIRINNL